LASIVLNCKAGLGGLELEAATCFYAHRKAVDGPVNPEGGWDPNAIILPEFFVGAGVWTQSSQAHLQTIANLQRGANRRPVSRMTSDYVERIIRARSKGRGDLARLYS